MRKLARLGGVMLMVACGSVEEQAAPTHTATSILDPAETTTTTELEVDDMPRPDLDLNRVVAAARTDLARRLGVAEEDIEVTSLETGVWRDGALGCPEPDMLYTQALVPGSRVVLTNDKEMYWYHQGGSGEVFLCEEPVEDAFTGSGTDELIPPPGYNQ